jgi:hypothetical protein
MTTIKTTLEDLIKAERALEAALVHTLSNASTFRTAGNANGLELICRERRELDKAQEIIRGSKMRLQALAEHTKIVPRVTKREVDTDCICEIPWTGMEARCKACHA